MEGVEMISKFYKNKKVLVTGHTGFKGAWLCRILQLLGAHVTGYGLSPKNDFAFEKIINTSEINSNIADICDFDRLQLAFDSAKPEIVFHLAAQPLVLDAFEKPRYTFDVNVQGTVNLLECVRCGKDVKSVVIVTTDKVYKNNDWVYGYRENDIIGDTEPYAASKACAEIVAASYYATFLKSKGIALSTVRAGNVIGGGDISKNRIIPDCIRAAKKGEAIMVRNPHSVRPYQHVLEPLFAYLLIAQRQIVCDKLAGQYNIGPGEDGCQTTGNLVDIFCEVWGGGQIWEKRSLSNAPNESRLLSLDCSKMRAMFSWKPKWDIKTAIEKTVEWEKADNKNIVTDNQIKEYMKRGNIYD